MWTKTQPTRGGWYWWRLSVEYGSTIYWVSSEGSVRAMFSLQLCPVAGFGGEWYGPLRAPGGDAVENCNNGEKT